MKAALIIFLISVNVFAQTFMLPELKIKQKEKGKTVTYDFENEKNKFIVTDSFLTTNPDKFKYIVPIQDIKKISIHDGSNFWQMAGIGSAVGGLFGMLIGLGISLSFGTLDEDIPFQIGGILLCGIALAVPTGLVFGLIGATVPYFESYSLTGDLSKRNQDLKNTFKKHRYRR